MQTKHPRLQPWVFFFYSAAHSERGLHMVFCNGPVHRAEAASHHSALPSALSPSAAFCAAAIFTYSSSGLWGWSLML